MIAPQLSWEGITFHNNVGDDECTQFLAKCGITLDEADNCLNFAFTWIQENNTPEVKEMHLCVLFSQKVAMGNAHTTVEPWHEPVLHRFNETHVRWEPIFLPPQQEASNENVVATATTRGIGWFTILSLAEFGQLTLQPSTSGSAEPAAAATETLVEVVARATDPPEDQLPPLPDHCTALPLSPL